MRVNITMVTIRGLLKNNNIKIDLHKRLFVFHHGIDQSIYFIKFLHKYIQ
jgi:hypothetical protein